MTEVVYWSGWVGGIAIGTYALAQFFLTGKTLGVSDGFTDACATFSKLPFFRQHKDQKEFRWKLWFLLGIPLGGLVAALTSPGPIVASFSLGTMYDSVLPASL